MTSPSDPAPSAAGAAPDEGSGVPAPVEAAIPSPTVLQRAKALWCQLVSGLG